MKKPAEIESRQIDITSDNQYPISKILLTGGGTGGHLSIVRAVKEELLKRGIRPYYIGSESGQDREWFANDVTFAKKLFLSTRGVVNQRGLDKMVSMVQVLKGVRRARRFIKEYSIEAVLSVGGFSAAPASFAAITAGTPLFIHEQNAISGRLNRLLIPFAKHLFSSYGNNRDDYPVSEIFFETARTRTKLETVIFLGGSQGARAINDFAVALAPWLQKKGISIIHQTGRSDFERVKKIYAKLGVDADVFAFDNSLYTKIAQADFAVSRAGASTLWELVANRLPALFVPYPYAAGDHQYHNACFLSERDAGWVVRQNELSSDIFQSISFQEIARASRKLATLIDRGGARKIVDRMLECR